MYLELLLHGLQWMRARCHLGRPIRSDDQQPRRVAPAREQRE
jgi:hypothetical protein